MLMSMSSSAEWTLCVNHVHVGSEGNGKNVKNILRTSMKRHQIICKDEHIIEQAEEAEKVERKRKMSKQINIIWVHVMKNN